MATEYQSIIGLIQLILLVCSPMILFILSAIPAMLLEEKGIIQGHCNENYESGVGHLIHIFTFIAMSATLGYIVGGGITCVGVTLFFSPLVIFLIIDILF